MLNHLRPAVVIFTSLTLITGVVYPLVVTGIGQSLFPDKANGSLIKLNGGHAAGSSLLGQAFSKPEYLWGRLSGTGPVPYTAFNADKATGSSGTNLAATSPTFVDNAKARIAALKAADALVGYARPSNQLIPIDLVTASGSGLDPHISPAAAAYQIPRIAVARNISLGEVTAIIAGNTASRQLGVLGEPVVNVLNVNRDLDVLTAKARTPASLP